MQTYGVIMAGGGGTRFWPLSRKQTPKQLLNLSGKEIMVNETIDRLSQVAENKNIFIVTNATQVEKMKEVTTGRVLPENILSEPSARNTAACIGYAAMKIAQTYGDGIMVITPSDAYIKDNAAYAAVLKDAIKEAETTDKLVTVGITPTFPATGYGYIQFKNTVGQAKPVLKFVEKPNLEKAKEYLASGEYVWNSGMFIWKASVILNKFKTLLPDIYQDLQAIAQDFGTAQEAETLNKIYPQIRSISIDYGVMEKSDDISVVPGEFGWNDVGSWDMLGVLHDADGNNNIAVGDPLVLESKNSIVYSSGKLVSVVGVDNLVVVETPDAIMVCPKDKAQDVKKIVEKLQEQKRRELL
ncbi:MAG: NTP transferase domain-containing protein [Clostridia bacterium]|nr:NTP transferase domain-containing protein [Clostridia bacterium]